MFPVYDLVGIEQSERRIGQNRAIILLLVKPSDEHAQELIGNFNYYHFATHSSCSVYAAGYSREPLGDGYNSIAAGCEVDGGQWWYSDRSFVEFVDELKSKIKWTYSGEPEILILQRSLAKGRHASPLSFSNYVALDACEGLRKGYVDSIPRLMQALINASEQEVRAKALYEKASRLSVKTIASTAIKVALESAHCPESLTKTIADRAFYRTANCWGAHG